VNRFPPCGNTEELCRNYLSQGKQIFKDFFNNYFHGKSLTWSINTMSEKFWPGAVKRHQCTLNLPFSEKNIFEICLPLKKWI
jgi:hypothetical protein